MITPETTTTIDNIIENGASNHFQLKTSLIAAIPGFIGFIFINITAILSPYLKCQWNMTTFQMALSSSIFYIGEAAGSFYWGQSGDLLGRKYPLILVNFGTIYFSLLSAVSQTVFWFMVTRFFVGQCVGAIYVLSMVYGIEFLKCHRRSYFPLLLSFYMAAGGIYSTAVAYFILNENGWKIYLLYLTAPLIFFLPLFAFLPESVRYLEISGRTNEIIDIVREMTKDNKSTILPKTIALKSSTKADEYTGSTVYLLCNYTKKIIALCVMVTSLALTYYGFNFLSVYQLQSFRNPTALNTTQCSYLTKEDLRDLTFINLSSIPFIIFAFGMLLVLRRKSVIAASLFANLLMFLLMLLPLPQVVSKAILYIGQGSNLVSFTIIFQYVLELFPTFVRSTALGFCSTVGKGLTIITPFIFQDMIYWSFPGVMVLMSTLAMLALISLLFLEETKDLHLV